MNRLILMVGLPRSGKSTAARRLGHPIVCPDAIRLALHGHRFEPRAEPFIWAIAKTMTHALFLAGHDVVVVDATNTTAKRRDDWRSDAWTIEPIFIDTPKDECVRRALAAGDADIVPIIERMAAAFEPLP